MRAARWLQRRSNPNQYAIDRGGDWLARLNLCHFGQKKKNPKQNKKLQETVKQVIISDASYSLTSSAINLKSESVISIKVQQSDFR